MAIPAAAFASRGLPQPGEQFGPYRIVRLLGEGGMGAAFEADDLESGRRVALKVLSHKLDSPEARERFFREGRLAASINHPNSVYVFGTEEVGGTPVISMELVSGGTLQDRVKAHGTLPVGEAVDAVLQIIAGLEAAERIGVLHRDVKPSNCFRDVDGTVKIGDFGLSISTAIRTEPALTVTGAFLGTPAFCSPEQLRGDELNARSDMYSVGATLFYLLTGRTPFEGKNPVQLLATVLEQRAPSPRKLRPNIPPGLAKIVLRCLEKQPAERFKNYRELAQALAPYGSAAPTPATLGLRFLAGTLDLLLLNTLNLLIALVVFGNPMTLMDLAYQRSPQALGWMLTGLCLSLFYYALFEGLWGAAAGKALCRLRVVRQDNNPPGFLRALSRTVICVVTPMLPYWIIYGGNPKSYLAGSSATQYVMAFSFYLVLALLFSTVRRTNGYGAIQDLMTQTRVISRAALAARPVLAENETMPPAVQSKSVVGPYHVLETLGQSAEVEWWLGYDLRLLRKVWIRVVPPGSSAVPASMRSVGRAGRLRWLTGRRSPEENWDAFEAVSGRPLVNLVEATQPWSQVRFWLYDLANEISAARKDGTLPVLALDRVWITGDGRAKLLDFPAPGMDGKLSPLGSAQPFLSEAAAAALEGRLVGVAKTVRVLATPPPLHARDFLNRLPQFTDAEAVINAIKPLLQRPAEVSRWRRTAIIAGCLVFPLLACLGMTFGSMFLERWNRSNPGLMELNMLLHQRAQPLKGRTQPSDRQFAIYISHHYRAVITNDAVWSSAFALALIKGDARRFAGQCVAENPSPTDKEIAETEEALGSIRGTTDSLNFMKRPWFPLAIVMATLAIYVAVPALIAALLFRGGLVLLIAGVTFVRRDGARASRLRVFWRAVLAWCPLLLVWLLVMMLKMPLGTFGAVLLASLLASGLAILSAALPQRGLPDRLAGTWPVPR